MSNMIEARPAASLSSGLLARKGAAKPAMRPQAWGQPAPAVEDLGWNDMGGAPDCTKVAAIGAAPAQGYRSAPPVVEQQRAAIAASFAAQGPAKPRSKGTGAKASAKAAFTLRLEAERHLKLRLACAVSGRSAQQLLTEALDELLRSRPEIDALASQLPGTAGKPR
jgi:hypothetical protein